MTLIPDGEVFAAFVRANAGSLFGTAYLLTGSPDAAEELVQDTLVVLFGKWAVVSAARSPVAYARRVLTNRFLDSRRGPRSRSFTVWQIPDSAESEDLAERVADRHLIWQLLGELPDRQRAAIVLRYVHDQPDEWIAESLGCRVATVRSLISRGVGSMRRSSRGSATSSGPGDGGMG